MSQSNCSWHNTPKRSANSLSSHQGDGGFGSYDRGDSGPELRSATLPDASGPPSALGQPSQPASHNLNGGIGNSHSNPTNWNYIYPNLFQDGSPSNYTYQIQNAPPTQVTEYAIDQTSTYVGFHPNYPHPEQQPFTCFQSGRFYPNFNTGNLATSPPPPHCQPARRGKKWGNKAKYSSPCPHACDICRTRFKRKADLYRHLNTTRAHCAPHGPVCPELGCKYTVRFTRVDNFRVHYKRQHGKNDDEVDGFIQEWKNRSSP